MEPPGAQWVSDYEYGEETDQLRRYYDAPGNRPVIEINCVCVPCNTGWMSNLEADAKPVLEPMIRGLPRKLSPQEQLLTATWTSKTVLVLEFLRKTYHVNDANDRRFIMDNQRPPPTYRVRLAYLDAIPEQAFRFQTFVATTDLDTKLPNVLCSSLLIGHLIIQCWGGPGVGTLNLQVAGTSISNAIMIWPPIPTGASWPPSVPITKETTEAFLREPIPHSINPGFFQGWSNRGAAPGATTNPAL